MKRHSRRRAPMAFWLSAALSAGALCSLGDGDLHEPFENDDPEVTKAIESVLPKKWRVFTTRRIPCPWAAGNMVEVGLSKPWERGYPTCGPQSLPGWLYLLPRDYDAGTQNEKKSERRPIAFPLIAATTNYQVFMCGRPRLWGWTNAAIDIAQGLALIDPSAKSTQLSDVEVDRYLNREDSSGAKYELTIEKVVELWRSQIARLRPIAGTNAIASGAAGLQPNVFSTNPAFSSHTP